ncbi:hypothetical protein G9A89_001881 [Geosiphon pyriformis]|nr:hypothetical protein G9A89_001881 [Geosiphon pyriformis]
MLPQNDSLQATSDTINGLIQIPFKPTYPPLLTINDLIPRVTRKGRTPTKPPNAFIIYRKNYTSEIKDKKISIDMSQVSSIVGQLWKEEAESVKDTYKKLARDAKDIFNKRFNSNYTSLENPPFEPFNQLDTQNSEDIMNPLLDEMIVTDHTPGIFTLNNQPLLPLNQNQFFTSIPNSNLTAQRINSQGQTENLSGINSLLSFIMQLKEENEKLKKENETLKELLQTRLG